MIIISIVPIYIYRGYYKKFKLNNLLYKYLYTREYLPKATIVLDSTIVFSETIKVIPSTTLITKLGTKFGFRSYYFLTLFIALSIVVITFSVYLDTRYLVILINRAFLLE